MLEASFRIKTARDHPARVATGGSVNAFMTAVVGAAVDGWALLDALLAAAAAAVAVAAAAAAASSSK